VIVEQLTREKSENGRPHGPRAQTETVAPEVVLRELFELLEDYAPMWYTEEHHRRAVAALIQGENQGAA
jgi:hypothetical protein